jgi:HEAT repeat protein
MRKHCVDCLQKSGDFKAVDPLIHMFDDLENEPITWEITEAIEQLCRWNNRKPIFKALHSGTARIRKQITLLLCDYLDDSIDPVLPELIKALKDPDTDVFVYVSKALEAWATYHNDRNSASDGLVACLTDNDPFRRLFAVSALGKAGNFDAAFAIIDAIHNNPDDTQFHDSAAISLAEISEEYEDEELNKNIDDLLNSEYFHGKDLF